MDWIFGLHYDSPDFQSIYLLPDASLKLKTALGLRSDSSSSQSAVHPSILQSKTLKLGVYLLNAPNSGQECLSDYPDIQNPEPEILEPKSRPAEGRC